MRVPVACLAAAMLCVIAARLPAAGVTPDPVALAARIHQEVNLARSRAGLPPLAWQAELATVAQAHSADMVRRDYFAHTDPDGDSMGERYLQAGYECHVQVGQEIHLGAENIALHALFSRMLIGSDGKRRYEWLDDAALARKVVDAWMQSEGHRRNLLAPQWRVEGIGLAFNDAWDVLITQNFC